jgi:hypothetical protein
MRVSGLAAAITVIAISCGTAAPSAGHPSVPASGSPSASPSGNPSFTSYGLLLSGGHLQIITPNGTVAASALVVSPAVHTCGKGTAAVLQPPVSATSDKVFFRDGNTAIRYLTPDGDTGNATTVPGSASKVSFFSVSPDDQRIAVLVEDLSPANKINITLYVEDLVGHANHRVIYTKSAPKPKGGSTLWPMGWHDGLLVLAVFPPCTLQPADLRPIEWHVANAVTAVRVATIGNPCLPSYWPSPAGVMCVDPGGALSNRYDWTGKITAGVSNCCLDIQSGLSPSGDSYFTTPASGSGAPPPSTRIVSLATARGAVVAGHSACLWIDENHLLAPDAVIGFQPSAASPSPGPTSSPGPTGSPGPTSTPVATATPGSADVPTSVTALPASGQCVGSFPGGL